MSKLHRIPDDEILALYAWMRHHRRRWRMNLRGAWHSGKYGPTFQGTDMAAALQRLRNGLTSSMFIEKTTEDAIRARVHHILLTRAAQELVDKLAPAGEMHPTYHAYPEVMGLLSILQEAPAYYDRAI